LIERSRAGVRAEGGNSNEVFADLAYRIEYSPDTDEHLRVLTARQRRIVFDAVDEQLAQKPVVETRNRKPMRPNPLAPWELRIGTLRVYFEIVEEPDNVVTILAVGVKDHNRVLIGGKEIEL
jgi:mRNA-degrading endonuclease RelE of RelBE toxin-antitoxin system